MSKSDKMNNIKWLISDFDRTFIQLFSETELKSVLAELKKTYIDYGISIDYLSQFRDPYDMWLTTYKYITEKYSTDQAEKIHHLATSIITYAEINAAKNAKLFSNIADTLIWLQNIRIKCAIVSTNSTEAINIVLQKHNLCNLITKVFGRDAAISMEQLKPNPALINQAITNLEADPQYSIYIGDSKEDMIAGTAAGLYVIGVTSGKTSVNELISSGANFILPGFSALKNEAHLFSANGIK